MKGNFPSLRVIIASVAALGLVACGGSTVTNVPVSGTISGLTAGPLVLSNALSLVSVQAGTTTFKFPSNVSSGLAYTVAVITQPPDMTCTVANSAGFAGTDPITNVAVTCANNRVLGGTVSNLKTGGLELVNGSNRLVIAANSTTFAFPTKVVAGTAYGVTVLTQPTGQTCSVTDGVGTMGGADISSVKVACN
jgi:hypothetical protein